MSEQRPVILSKTRHAGLTYKPVEDYAFTAEQTVVPLLPAEVPEAALCFPVIFPNPGNAVPHALLGLGDKNIFVNGKGGWTAPYVPLIFGNHPFSLAQARFTNEASGEQRVETALSVVEDAPHFRKKNGRPLYTPEGEPTETLQRILTALARQHRSWRESETALQELQASGVLREQVITVRCEDRERSVGGLRTADRDKVLTLPDATLGRWVKLGLMELLFAHWRSLRRLQALLQHPSCPRGTETPGNPTSA